jgi:RNA polymerase sigma-70 factor (ECF subfamily)
VAAGLRPDLVERAQRGDREAFDALATAVYHRLYAVGRRIMRDSYAAEDAVQETLIKAWRELPSLRDTERFEAWMHRLLVRACHDQTRRRRSLVSASVTPLEFERPDPSDEYAAVAHRDEIEQAFLRLSVEQRAVLVLTHYVGMPAVEVGRVLGVPTGTVYSRLHYAIRAMRSALAHSRSKTASGELLEPGR